ncbi:peptidylprolyl isomerase [Sphingomonas sp.]|uniref:peptidylprolyl isomerase n=1 Tax=Sphingomonas sp. TaxID=28214 RepID=UPI003B00D932
MRVASAWRRGAALVAAAATLAAAPAPVRSPGEIAAAAPASAWRDIPADALLVMTLGDGRRVTIELAPGFAPAHVANIRALARAGGYDGRAITRVQDNYVVQWGDAADRRATPTGVIAKPAAEYDRPVAGLALTLLPVRDAYAAHVGFAGGWPVASEEGRAWLPHCYGFVGVGRDMPPDTGDGRELYAVIGHAPRHLDRNIAVVGRVIDGIEALSALPRGTGALGVYERPGQRVPIASIRLAADLPAAGRPAYQTMRTDGAAFAAYVDARLDRRDAFFVRPAGGADLCNVPVPVRRRP